MSRQYIFFISQIKLYNCYAKKQKSCLKSQNTGKKTVFTPIKTQIRRIPTVNATFTRCPYTIYFGDLRQENLPTCLTIYI